MMRYSNKTTHKNYLVRALFIFILLAFISCSNEVQHLSSIHPETYRIDKRTPSDADDIEAMISPYRANLEDTMNEVIGQLEIEMIKSKPNSPLNNWIADVLLSQAQKEVGDVDFALQNYGGIRIPALGRGDITIGKIYELMPFENMLVVLKAEGKIIQQLLDGIADYGGWPISSGTSFTIENGKAVDITINGQPFDISKKYSFALPDYIANGGDGSHFLKDSERIDLGILVRDAIIKEIRDQKGNIPYNDEIRIKN